MVIITTLWVALRCGVSHTGFMQDEHDEHVDVQVTEKDTAPLMAFSDDPVDPGYMLVEVGGKKFVESVICELRAVIKRLNKNTSERESKFLPLWQRRLGSYPYQP